ncbi:thioredoxin family protein [Mesonia mobilis]|uniref:Thioredoxin family protein n=1 Tax=Mesonia mobilis TaxID=369791 RepID=A0ABQ3BIX3_9FLAO|nr:thioredoxin family protein [Mesonia mobilis]MBQ0738465.1 thioredoxin family protein [Aquimarina celericrescens]GGZ47395.1 thioredoxin family protein [Mesonia mobilis]
MKTLKILTIAAIIIAASAFAVNNVFEEGEASNSSENGYEIGDVATDFKLKNIDGKQVSMSDYSTTKGFIVVFTTNHCPYAKAYENRIVALDKKYKTKGYPVIAINPNNPEKNEQDSFENMQIRAKQKGFTFPYLLDEGQKIYPQYGATKTPHVYILQKENKALIVKYIGAIDDNYQDVNAVEEKFVENAVDELLAGKEVSVKTTKAIGCSIK